jgi:hypothetical protein
MAEPLVLTLRQRGLIDSAARSVPPADRDEYVRRVYRQLIGPEVSDAAVAAVVNAQLDSLPYLTTTAGTADAHVPLDQTNTETSK